VKMRWLFLAIMLVLSMVLGACKSNGDSVENAEKFLEAVDKKDADTAILYLCPDKEAEIESIIDNMKQEDYTFKDIQCTEQDGENVQCTFKLVVGENDERDTTFSFVMENHKVCDIKE
jgi:hypothetical protein